MYPSVLLNFDYLEQYWVFNNEQKKNENFFLSIIMPTDLVKFYTNSFDPLNFYEYLLQKNIDDYEEQNQDVKVRDNPALFQYAVLMTLNEANKHNSKHGRKSFFELDEKKS